MLAELGTSRREAVRFDGPTLAVDRDRLDEIQLTLRPTRLAALGGVVSVAVIAGCIGLYRWAPYAVIAVAAGAAAAGLVWVWPAALERRVPAGISRGGLLGAGVAVIFLALALVVFVALRRATGL